MTPSNLVAVLALGAVLAVVLIAIVVRRPEWTAGGAGKARRGGRVIAFVAFLGLPLVITTLGVTAHLEHSKSTEFCLSCHVMEPYGQSLYIDDSDFLAATHFQNNLIPRDRACFTCHTTYTMYGDLQAKLQGLKHVWVYYLGDVPDTLTLYQPYNNRECLNCHRGGRRFEEDELHLEVRAELESNETSCLECHESTHDIARLGELATWEGGTFHGD